MHRLTLTTLFAILVLFVLGAMVTAAPNDTYTYDSMNLYAMGDQGMGYSLNYMTPDPGNGFPDYHYSYQFTNYSYTTTIVSWVWNYNGQSGNVMPENHLDELNNTPSWTESNCPDTQQTVFPMAASIKPASKYGDPTPTTVDFEFDDAQAPLTGTGHNVLADLNGGKASVDVVMSTVVFSDGTHINNLPVWIPSNSVSAPSVPEPGSLVALFTGLVGLAGLVGKRKA